MKTFNTILGSLLSLFLLTLMACSGGASDDCSGITVSGDAYTLCGRDSQNILDDISDSLSSASVSASGSASSSDECANITVDGDDYTLCGPNAEDIVSEIEDHLSSGSSGGTSGESMDTSSMEAITYAGTYCLASGAPYYLAIIINSEQNAAQVAYYVDNANFLNNVSSTLAFTARAFSISSTSAGSLQTYSTATVSDINQYAEMTHPTSLYEVDFGSFSALYSQSSTEGSCPGLTVTQDQVDSLNYL